MLLASMFNLGGVTSAWRRCFDRGSFLADLVSFLSPQRRSQATAVVLLAASVCARHA